MNPGYLLGIGGTGSKCLESFIYAAAAGLGPERVGVALVDQDVANGNLTATKQLVSRYRGLHDELRGTVHNLDGSALFGTKLICADNPVWSPLPAHQTTLDEHFNFKGLRSEAKLLFAALFDDRFERRQQLNEGFRGRPAVGAAAMFSAAEFSDQAAESADQVWKHIIEEMRSTEGSKEFRVFIVASIFGGTGASGFPTIARILRDKAKDEKVRLRLAGALLLPYFKYPDPVGEEKPGNLAQSRAFITNSKQALLYYHHLSNQQNPDLFDSLYLVGLDPLCQVDFKGAGGGRQKNPPLLPELLSALAACRFFRAKEAAQRKVLRAGRSDSSVTWEQIPQIDRNGNGHDTKQQLGCLLRFAIAYLMAYHPYLKRENYKRFVKQAWYQALIKTPEVEVASDDNHKLLSELEEFCMGIVQWAADLNLAVGPSEAPMELFHLNGLLRNEDAGHNGEARISLRALDRSQRQAFQKLIPPGTSRGLEQIFLEMCRSRVGANGRGLGVFLGRLYEQCEI